VNPRFFEGLSDGITLNIIKCPHFASDFVLDEKEKGAAPR
jgi:hypothetical protein